MQGTRDMRNHIRNCKWEAHAESPPDIPNAPKTLPEREGGPLAVGESPPAQGRFFSCARTIPNAPKKPSLKGRGTACGG